MFLMDEASTYLSPLAVGQLESPLIQHQQHHCGSNVSSVTNSICATIVQATQVHSGGRHRG